MENGCLGMDSVMRGLCVCIDTYVSVFVCERVCVVSFICFRYSSGVYIWPGPLLGNS